MKIVKGYIRGRAFDLIVVDCDGKLVEASTALAWSLMKEHAAIAGIDLYLTSGWRSFEEQQAIWAERSDPTVRARKGVAAKPGHSNHQSGTAVDIRTGMTLADLHAGKKTPTFIWLEQNAIKYGFKRTVPSEPWHWERTPIMEDRSP